MKFHQNAIEVLLNSYAIPREFHLSTASNTTLVQTDCNSDPRLQDNFIFQECIQYFLKDSSDLSVRKICFLIQLENSEITALLIECSDYNVDIAKELRFKAEKFHNNLLASIEEQTSFIKEFRTLYQSVQCIWITNGDNALTSYESHIIRYLRQVYVDPKFIRTPFSSYKGLNYPIALIESTKHFMEKGKINPEIDISIVHKNQSRHMIAILSQSLSQVEQERSALGKELFEHLLVLYRYHQLIISRQKYSINSATLEQLDIIQNDINISKNLAYTESLPNKMDYLNYLNFETLMEFFACKDIQNQLNCLKKQRQKHLSALQCWENNLAKKIAHHKKSWRNYIYWSLKKTTDFIYNNTYIGFFAELLQWLGEYFTSSTNFSNQITTAIHPLFKQVPFYKIMGGSLGILISWFYGSYHFIRLLFTSLFCSQLAYFFSESKLDDENARIKSNLKWLPEKNGSMIITTLAISASETVIEGTYSSIFKSLSSLLGRSSATYSAKYLFSSLRSASSQTMTEPQTFSLYFISMAGMEIGRVLFNYGYHLLLYQQHCQIAADKLMELSQPYVKALTFECPRPTQNWKFWFSSNYSIPVSWITNDNYYSETHCYLEKFQIKEGWDRASCDSPVIKPTFRLQ